MINWIKWDESNPPADGKYLILSHWGDGDPYIMHGYWREMFGRWHVRGSGFPRTITHYAHINLPGEETDNEQITIKS